MTNAVNISQVGSNNTTFRNRIINGAMMIDQRNAGASVTPTNGQYIVDRFYAGLTQASKFTVQQNAGSVTPPAGYTKYLGVTSSSAYSVLTGDTFYISQLIEGQNVADLGWGAAGAATVTLSFWVRSSLTGTFGGSITNVSSRSYPYTYTINSANTWEQKTVTIPGDTSGTWLTTNGIGVAVWFGLGSGATYSATSGAWASGVFVQPTGTTSVVGTNGATFYITGVQLEAGSAASPFENRSYGTELALCQRYYSVINSNYSLGYTAGNTVTQGGGMYNLKVSMRVAPSIDSAKPGAYTVSAGSAGTVGLQYSTTESVNLQNASSNWTASNTVYLSSNLGLTAEL